MNQDEQGGEKAQVSEWITVNEVRVGFYLDSVALMRISADIAALDGIDDAALMIGTVNNQQILAAAGLLTDAGNKAGASDLILALRGRDAATVDHALASAQRALSRLPTDALSGVSRSRPRSLEAALREQPESNLALISVPGEFAVREARQALRSGLNVMIFSDNVSVDDELALKQLAAERDLIVMGPDCGTAYLNGNALAFGNAIPRGPIGVIAASGTGLQEFSVLLARSGLGLSHGIGVGGRDMGDAIGAVSTLTALDWLEDDPQTETIVVLTKPPGAATQALLFERLNRCVKPVIAGFIGGRPTASGTDDGGVRVVSTLRQAAELVLGETIGSHVAADLTCSGKTRERGRWLRGLYTGGTLCAESQVVLCGAGFELQSNAPIPGVVAMSASNGALAAPDGHLLIDFGADQFTIGRPHPMIDPSVRNARMAKDITDSEVAVILFDLVLGFGAHPDPAGEIVATVANCRNDRPVLIASVCGVPGDPQDYSAQKARLVDIGVVVAPSNAHAAELAANCLLRE